MRLCTVKGRKAMFHCWEQISEIVPPSPMRGGHQGGTVRYTVGIVEYEAGGVESVSPGDIVFRDTEKFIYRAEREIAKWEAKKKSLAIEAEQHAR